MPTVTHTPAPTPTETATPTETPAPTDVPVPSATFTLEPAAEPTDTVTPAATFTPGPAATPTMIVHVVQPGDNLSNIAGRYGVSVDALIAANDIRDRGVIEVGEQLLIPSPSASAVQTEGAGTSPQIASDTPPEELPDEVKAMILETALKSDQSVLARDVRIFREQDRETILIVIQTQGGQGSIVDETTLREATTGFIYAYQGDERLKIEAKYVLVQAQNDSGQDAWYAVATIDDVGLLANGEITPLEFLERIRVDTP
jgi:LysM repeat protein